MNSWTQALCRHCSTAFALGAYRPGNLVPVKLRDTMPTDPCLVCGAPTRIYVRIDPKLTEGMPNAKADAE